MPNNNLILRTLISPWVTPTPDITKSSVLKHVDVDNNFIYLRGELIYTAQTAGSTVTLKKINGNDLSFITENNFVTGGTYNPSTLKINFTGNDGFNPFSVDVASLLDTFVSGGTYNPSNGCVTFVTTSGYTFDVCGFLTGVTQYWTSGSSGNYSIKTINDSSVDATGNYAVAEGFNNIASGEASHAEGGFPGKGWFNTASGPGSHAEGASNTASGDMSHAEGFTTTASGNFSHAEGDTTTASNNASHAEGIGTLASGYGSHAEGFETLASGPSSHAEGGDNSKGLSGGTASGIASHAEGVGTLASGDMSHARGYQTTASGLRSTSSGSNTVASGEDSTASGMYTTASGYRSTASGMYTTASGYGSTASGYYTTASGYYSHAEGQNTTANGNASHAEGNNTTASGNFSHAEGQNTTSSGIASHAEGYQTIASGSTSHAEGYNTIASGEGSHAEGYGGKGNVTASGLGSHAEGFSTTASGPSSHAEGLLTIASGESSHAEGQGTLASGGISHAEGVSTTASGTHSHAEGQETIASGTTAHAEGFQTQALGNYSHAEGYGNKSIGDGSHTEGGVFNEGPGDPILFIANSATTYSAHAEGTGTLASGMASHSQNVNTTASGYASSASGNYTTASGAFSSSQGFFTTASGNASHSEGQGTTASGNNSHAEGSQTIASGGNSHAEGQQTTANNDNSHAEGRETTASGLASHAEGYQTIASGNYSHAEGRQTTSSGKYSHTEGRNNTASGSYSHAEGRGTVASTIQAHAEGKSTVASGISSHAEGGSTTASGGYSHAQGAFTTASGQYSTASGYNSIASGNTSTAEGYQTIAGGDYSHAEGYGGKGAVIASGIASHAEGGATTASGYASHAEGLLTTASGDNSHAEGNATIASGYASHAEGDTTTASGNTSHAEGSSTIAGGNSSHAEGNTTIASGDWSHAEGNFTKANGFASHAEGNATTASNIGSHAEGNDTTASGVASHAEGEFTTASGRASHAEGYLTQANGYGSHAEGGSAVANGFYSHAQGYQTTSSGNYSTASGYFSTASGNTSFIHSTNSLVTGDRSVVLGGQNITGTTNDTVYVPYLNIGLANGGAPIAGLSLDVNGNVITGTTGLSSGSCISDLYVTNIHGCSPVTIKDDLIIEGDLTILGTATTVNIKSEDVYIADNFVLLNSNVSGGTPTQNSGIDVRRGDQPNGRIVWNETDNRWEVGTSGTTYEVITTNNIGSFTANTLEQVLSTSGYTGTNWIDVENGYGLRRYLGPTNYSYVTINSGGVTLDTQGSNQSIVDVQNNGRINIYSGVRTTLESIEVLVNAPNGVKYVADYSGAYTNRSLVDKEYVDNTNSYVTGFTYNDANTLTLSRNNGLGDLTATIDSVTGLTVNGNLNVTGNTEVSGTLNIGTLGTGTSVTNLGLDASGNVVTSSGGADTYVTGGTYSSGTLTLDRNDGNSVSVSGLSAGFAIISGTPLNNQISVFTASDTIEGKSNFIYDSSINTMRITGNTGGIIIDTSEDPTPLLSFSDRYQAVRVTTEARTDTHDPEDMSGGNTLVVGMSDAAGQPAQGEIGPSVGFSSADDAGTGGSAGLIRIVKGSTSFGTSEDGTLMILGTRRPSNILGGDASKLQEGLRIGDNRYLGVNYYPSSFGNPPAMLTVGTNVGGDNTLAIRSLSGTPAGIANYGQFYVKSSDSLPYFKDGSGNESPLVTAGPDSITFDIFNTSPASPDPYTMYDDGNIRLLFDETTTDDIEILILTNPSTGPVHVVWSEPTAGTSGSVNVTTASGQVPLNSEVTADNVVNLVIWAPSDATYPYYEAKVTVSNGSFTSIPAVARVSKWNSPS